MDDSEWQALATPNQHRLREGLALLRHELPSGPASRAWSRFQFLPLDGGTLEVDALVTSPAGICVVGVETFGGRLETDEHVWRHTRQNGSTELVDPPLRQLRYKARELRDLLDHFLPDRVPPPRIEPLVFLSRPELDLEVASRHAGLEHVAFHPSHDREPSILTAIVEGEVPGMEAYASEVSQTVVERLGDALERSDIISADHPVHVGPWRLGELLGASPKYKDYRAHHRADERDDTRWARVFWSPKGANDDQLSRLQEAARRETSILDNLQHPSILEVREHIGHETRPAILFDDPEGARRLDHVVEAGELPPPARRLEWLADVADAMRYTHGQKVVHRSLGPQSILLVEGGDEVRVFNWHTGRRPDHETGTRHVSDYLGDEARGFMAPELLQGPDVGEAADVFGLGALAFYLLTETPPARSISDLVAMLREHDGLRPSLQSSVELSASLDELIYEATRPRPDDRLDDVDIFKERLEALRESDLPSPDTADPLEVEPGARLDDRSGTSWTVERRLGTGSVATALAVTDLDEREFVLKVANDDHSAERLEHESEALEQLDSDHVVDLHDRTRIGGRRTLVLQHAGRTLRRFLQDRSGLSLDEQRRFGDDLGRILRDLERADLFHRDIKPSNLGVGQIEQNRGPLSLLLFDFSLHGVDATRTRIGTDAYRDPFLTERGRWDFQADRYSAALVFYEMVTNRLPQWGEEGDHPAAVGDVELHLHRERFPAPVRDDLVEFFQTALAREVDDRFASAEAMRGAWRSIFETTIHSTHERLDLEVATPGMRLATLGISEAAREALASLGLETVGDLVQSSSQPIYFQEGIGGDVKDELTSLHSRLRDVFPQLVDDEHDENRSSRGESVERDGLDRLVERLEEPTGAAEACTWASGEFPAFVRLALGPHAPEIALPWPRWSAILERVEATFDVEDDEASRRLEALRRTWRDKRTLESVRDDLVDLIEAKGGVSTARQVALGLLGLRGSLTEGRERRLAEAAAVARAALEGERLAESPRIARRRLEDESSDGHDAVFVATQSEWLDLLPALGELADTLAHGTTIPGPRRAERQLTEYVVSAGLDPLSERQLLEIGAAASRQTALSQRDELYPEDMSAERALRLTANLLRRRAPLDADELRDAVHERYPAAEMLPKQPEIERLVEGADVGLEWSIEADDGKGAYVSSYRGNPSSPALSGTATSSRSRHSTLPSEDAPALPEDVLDTLERRASRPGFFAVVAAPERLEEAADRLAERYGLTPVSIDALLIEEVRRVSETMEIPWETILQADAMDWDDPDHQSVRDNLEQFVFHTGEGESSVAWRVCERLRQLDSDRLLLTHPGLLGRWDRFLRHEPSGKHMQIVGELQSRTDERGPDVVWMLVPQNLETSKPKIGDRPLPIDAGDYLHLGGDALEALRSDASQQASGGEPA